MLYLSVSELVLGVVYVQSAQQFLHSLPAVHKRVLWNRIRIQDAITEKEKYTWITEEYQVRKSGMWQEKKLGRWISKTTEI